jgi:hypothetical protein
LQDAHDPDAEQKGGHKEDQVIAMIDDRIHTD